MDKSGELINQNTDNTNGKVKSILLIDDDDTTCLLIKEILSDYNVRITTAKTGKKALGYIENVKFFDLVIIDIRLPDMDGFDLFFKIKSSGQPVPVIALTALANKQIKEISLKSGFSEFIEKPTDIDLLLSVIERYII